LTCPGVIENNLFPVDAKIGFDRVQCCAQIGVPCLACSRGFALLDDV
jgi:glutaredoxin-related protein